VADDAECSSLSKDGFLVRSYLGCLDRVKVDRVGGDRNLEAFRQISLAQASEFHVVALWTFQISTQLSQFALVIPPDLIAATRTSALIHIGHIISLSSILSSRMRTILSR
jgi:hypothetical protein